MVNRISYWGRTPNTIYTHLQAILKQSNWPHGFGIGNLFEVCMPELPWTRYSKLQKTLAASNFYSFNMTSVMTSSVWVSTRFKSFPNGDPVTTLLMQASGWRVLPGSARSGMGRWKWALPASRGATAHPMLACGLSETDLYSQNYVCIIYICTVYTHLNNNYINIQVYLSSTSDTVCSLQFGLPIIYTAYM